MKKYLALLSLVFVVVFTGCSGLKEVNVGNLRSLEIKGFENNKLALQIVVPVDNPNPYRVKIKDAGIRIMNGNSELGKVTQMDDVTISGKTSKDYPVNVTVELTGLKNSNLFAMYRLLSNPDNLRITGELKARYFLYTKALKIDYPLSH